MSVNACPDPGFSPYEDADDLCFVGRCAVRDWLSKVEPFQRVRMTYPDWEHERVGKEMTAHVDLDARSRVEARAKLRQEQSHLRLTQAVDRVVARARQARERALIDAGAIPDDVAAGW